MASSQKSYWLKSASYNLMERISVMIFGFGSLILLLRAFTKEEFGSWVLFLTIVSLFEVARIGLLQNALVKYLTTCEEDEYAKISSASLVLNLILTGINILILILIAKPLSIYWEMPELNQMLWIYSITTLVLVPFFQFNFIQQANLDFKGIFLSNFWKQGLFFAYILFFYLASKEITLINLTLLQIFTSSIGAIVSYFYSKKYLRFDRMIDWTWVKKLFNFGRFVFGTNLSTMLYKSIDKVMLASLIGKGPVAVYDLAIRITNLAEVPSFSISSIVFPQSAKRMKTEGKNAIKLLYEKSVGAILAMIVPFIIFTLMFPEFIIKIIASEKYLDTVPILRLTILYGLFMPYAIQFGTVLDSIGKPKINFYFTLLGAFLNIVFNYIFIKMYGLIGAAYGTLISYSITFVLMQIVLKTLLNVNIFDTIKYAYGFYGQGYRTGLEFLKKKFSNKVTETF